MRTFENHANLLTWQTDSCTPWRMASNAILNAKVGPFFNPSLRLEKTAALTKHDHADGTTACVGTSMIHISSIESQFRILRHTYDVLRIRGSIDNWGERERAPPCG